jgi:hypothetical protein
MKTLIFVFLATGLAGCQTTAMKTPASISFNNVMEGVNEQATADEAQAHCRKYGKNAQFIPHQMGWDARAHFKCV